jgi:hypothetical protein
LESSPGLHKCLKIRAQYTFAATNHKITKKNILHTETARGGCTACKDACMGSAHWRRCCALTDCSALTLLLPIVSCGVGYTAEGCGVSSTIGVARLILPFRENVRADFWGWGGGGGCQGVFFLFYYYIHIAPFFGFLLLIVVYYMNI